jgi:hypothetical protein
MKMIQNELKVTGAICIDVVTYIEKMRQDIKARRLCPPLPTTWDSVSSSGLN